MTDNQVETNDGESRNARIANLLGYTVRYWYGSDTREHWDLLDVDGAVVGTADTEAEAWKYAPDFEHDLNVTWETLLSQNDDEHRYALEVYDSGLGINVAIIRNMVADAIITPVWREYSDHNVQDAASAALEATLVAKQETNDAD